MRLLMELPGLEGFDSIFAFEYESAQKASDDLFEILTGLERTQKEFNENYRRESEHRDALRRQCGDLGLRGLPVPKELSDRFMAENTRMIALWQSQPSYKFTFAGREFELEDFAISHEGLRQQITRPEIRTVDSFFE